MVFENLVLVFRQTRLDIATHRHQARVLLHLQLGRDGERDRDILLVFRVKGVLDGMSPVGAELRLRVSLEIHRPRT